MSTQQNSRRVTFIYDGECPICTHAAMALRIKQDFGNLVTLDARTNAEHALVKEVNNRGLDLDEGMVIFANDVFYHGDDALKLMAEYGEARNPFMFGIKGLFWSNTLAFFMYPWLRGARNWALARRKVPCIDNLERGAEPTFKPIFGDSWEELPLVLKKHYANRPYSNDVTTVLGRLNVTSKAPLSWFRLGMKVLGQIPIANENAVPVQVNFESESNSVSFGFNRIFQFAGGKVYKFRSKMIQVSNDVVVEVMRFGLAWKLRYSWDGEKVVLSHLGYGLRIFGHLMPLPLNILLGEGYAEEKAIDDNTFEMRTHITHPWWGKVYEYSGRFEVVSCPEF